MKDFVKKPNMKIGDLIQVCETRACGGVPNGAIGLVIADDSSQPTTPRWIIRWVSGAEMPGGLRMKESTTYGYGIEVISESR